MTAEATQSAARTDADKVRLFRDRFRGLDHVYGTYDPDSRRVYVEQLVDALTG